MHRCRVCTLPPSRLMRSDPRPLRIPHRADHLSILDHGQPSPSRALDPAELSSLLSHMSEILARLSIEVPAAGVPSTAPMHDPLPRTVAREPMHLASNAVPTGAPLRMFIVPPQRSRSWRRRAWNWLADSFGLPASCRG